MTVVSGETGWLTPRADPATLAKYIKSLLSDPVQARVMGERGRQRVQQHFSVIAMVEQVENIYGQVLGRTA